MGIAVLDGQWVSWDITGLLGMWDRHCGTNRGADGCVEAVFSVLENQGGKAAGVTTTRIISAHTSVQAEHPSSPHPFRQTVFRGRACGTLPCWAEARTLQCLLEWVHEQHMAACY